LDQPEVAQRQCSRSFETVGPQPVVLGPVPRPRRIDIVRMREPAERNRMRSKPPSAQGRLPIGWVSPRLQLQSPLQELATGAPPEENPGPEPVDARRAEQ